MSPKLICRDSEPALCLEEFQELDKPAELPEGGKNSEIVKGLVKELRGVSGESLQSAAAVL